MRLVGMVVTGLLAALTGYACYETFGIVGLVVSLPASLCIGAGVSALTR